MRLSISRPLVLAIALSQIGGVPAFAAQPPKAIAAIQSPKPIDDYAIVAQLDSKFASDRQAAAEQGDADAQYGMGMMYFQGRGVMPDSKLAVTWFRKAAEQGHVDAQYRLGRMYETGEGVAQDAKQAVAWYRQAAEQGYATAQSYLGAMYYRGEGVVQDAKQAVAWWRKAAEQGEVEAQHNLGAVYYKGEGVEQDTKQAVAWVRKAAEQGEVESQSFLGGMYYKGEGVEQDAKLAAAWFRKAAEQGNVGAQQNLGVMYYKGEGVERDTKQAEAWFRKAAEQGNVDAQNNLEQIQKEARNALNAELPKKQWWVVDSSYTECFETGGPAAKLDEFVGFTDKPSTKDFTGPDGKLVKVEVINENGYGQETVWTYYTTKQMCEAEQVNATKSLADKYR